MATINHQRTLSSSMGALFCGFLVALSGCGAGSSRTITGTITFAGEPVKEGQIIVRPTEGPVDAGDIKDGAYTVTTTVGPKQVEISATRETGKLDVLGGPAFEQFIPDRYNSRSELTIEVTADGDGKFDFDLKP